MSVLCGEQLNGVAVFWPVSTANPTTDVGRKLQHFQAVVVAGRVIYNVIPKCCKTELEVLESLIRSITGVGELVVDPIVFLIVFN